LSWGSAPARAGSSSSALAVNSFVAWQDAPQLLKLADVTGFTGTLAFEAKCPNGVSAIPPHLDVLLERGDEIVAVESKCTEFLSTKKSVKVSPRYLRLAERGDERAESRWFASLALAPEFRLLDAYQLIKHYLGLSHEYSGRPAAYPSLPLLGAGQRRAAPRLRGASSRGRPLWRSRRRRSNVRVPRALLYRALAGARAARRSPRLARPAPRATSASLPGRRVRDTSWSRAAADWHAPIRELVERIRRETGLPVPDVDPASPGAAARVLHVLIAPSRPGALETRIPSPTNPDGTARNQRELMAEAGLSESIVTWWNAVPWDVGDRPRPTAADIRQGAPYIRDLVDRMPRLFRVGDLREARERRLRARAAGSRAARWGPEALLARIIRASSDEAGTVLGPFCGCGTVVAFAQRLKRCWIGIDITHLAINLIPHRPETRCFVIIINAYSFTSPRMQGRA
jgi:hypothetical protein